MASIIEFINSEYRKNIKMHQDQAQPAIDFLQKAVDTKYQQEEAVKVRGEQISSLGQSYRLKTGDETPINVPSDVDPNIYFEGKMGEYERKQAPIITRESIVNEAQKEYSDEIKTIGKIKENDDPEEWFGKLKALRTSKTTLAKDVSKGTFYKRSTGGKVTIIKIDPKAGTGETLAGKTVNLANYTETVPTKPSGTGEDATKWADKNVGIGTYDDIIALDPDATEDMHKKAFSMGNSLPDKNISLPTGEYDKNGNPTEKIVKRNGIQQVKRAIKFVGNRTIEEISTEIDDKIEAKLNTVKEILSTEEKKKNYVIFGGGKGKYDKEKVSDLKKQIKAIESGKEKKTQLASAKAKVKIVEDIVGKKKEETIKTITTQAEYDKLPSGTIYLEDGVQYRKP